MRREVAPYVRHPVRRALARGLWRLLGLAALGAVAAALAPVTLAAAAAAAAGWWRGWPPRRLYATAAWCLPMTAAWLAAVAAWPARAAGSAAAGAAARAAGLAGTGTAGAAIRSAGVAGMAGAARAAGRAAALPGVALPAGVGPGPLWLRAAAAPCRAWLASWQLAAHGHLAAAAVAAAPPAVPLGVLAGGLAWQYRLFRMRTGAGGLTPAAPATFDSRLWRRQVRTAKALLAAPGALPLISRNGLVVTGAAIRSVRHRATRAAAIPYPRLRSHQVVIGSTGTGKTTLLLRLWAGFMAAGLRGYAAGAANRPLLVVLDCKGGASSRKVADRTRRVLRDAGARSTAIWPDEASLSLWTLPPGQLVTTLLDLIEHGTGGAAYYTDVMEAIVSLAVSAPCGPPVCSADFLARLDPGWLAASYAASGDGAAVTTIRSGKRGFEDVELRFRALWRRLGAGLDGGGSFGDADAWYCVLEGTAEGAVAEAQARALTDLLAHYAVGGQREILLAVDEFSAVSRRLPIWRLYERARALGLAVQVSAQSWEGLADTDDERQRIAATAEGGIWLLRTPRPGPVSELAGTRAYVDTTRRFAGQGAWAGDGMSRTRLVPVLDADIVRQLDVGQAAYVYRGGVTYVQVKRLTGRQAALAPAAGDAPTMPLPAVAVPAQWPPVPPPPPDASEVLDEAFGARHE
jgi:hypothetical protein